jgi:hypothetical protein
LWTYYGVTKAGGLLVATVNGFGAVVEIVYVTLFLVFAPPRMRVYVNYSSSSSSICMHAMVIYNCPP